MKMTKKWVAVSFAGLMGAFLFTGCLPCCHFSGKEDMKGIAPSAKAAFLMKRKQESEEILC